MEPISTLGFHLLVVEVVVPEDPQDLRVVHVVADRVEVDMAVVHPLHLTLGGQDPPQDQDQDLQLLLLEVGGTERDLPLTRAVDRGVHRLRDGEKAGDTMMTTNGDGVLVATATAAMGVVEEEGVAQGIAEVTVKELQSVKVRGSIPIWTADGYYGICPWYAVRQLQTGRLDICWVRNALLSAFVGYRPTLFEGCDIVDQRKPLANCV